MADLIEVIAKFRDEASRELERFGSSLERVAKIGIEPLAKLSPTLGTALEGVVAKLGPTGLALTALAGAATAAVAGLATVVKSVADTADELKDLSQVTGASVESLSALGHAASKAGGSLQEVAGSFKFMQKAISDATEGSKEANAAFERLGLSAQALKQQSPEEQFEAIAKAIAAIEDPAEKSKAAMQMFGRAGAQLIPVLNSVAEEGMGGVIQKAKELGIVISSETAEAGDAFNDTLADLMAVGKGLAYELGSALLPVFLDLAKIILEATMAVTRFLRESGLIQATMIAIRIALAPAIEAVRLLAGGLIAASQALRGDFQAALDTLKNTAANFGNAVVEAFGGGAKVAEASAVQMTASAQKSTVALEQVNQKVQQVSAEIALAGKNAAAARAKAEAEAAGDRTAVIQIELAQKVEAIRAEEQKRLESIQRIGMSEEQAAKERAAIARIALDEITAANQQAVTAWLEIEKERASAIKQVDMEVVASREALTDELAQLAAQQTGNRMKELEAELTATFHAIHREREERLANIEATVKDVEVAAAQRVATEKLALDQIALAEANLAAQRLQIVRSNTDELLQVIRGLGTAYAEELKPLQLMQISENLQRQLSMLDAAFQAGMISMNAYVEATARAQQQADAAATAIHYNLQPAVESTVQEFAAGTQEAAGFTAVLSSTATGLDSVSTAADMATASVSRFNAAAGTAVGPDLQATAEAALASATATRPYGGDIKGKAVYIPEGMFHIQGDIRGKMFDMPSQFIWRTPDIYRPGSTWAMPQALKQYAPMMHGDPVLGQGWYQFPGGGMVPGPMGQPAMALVESGETIVPTGASVPVGAGGQVNIYFQREVFVDTDERMNRLAQDLWNRIRDRQRRLLTQ